MFACRKQQNNNRNCWDRFSNYGSSLLYVCSFICSRSIVLNASIWVVFGFLLRAGSAALAALAVFAVFAVYGAHAAYAAGLPMLPMTLA